MAELGADYSWARPGGAALAAAGVKGVGRYLAADGRGITANEYADLKANNIDVWLVREGAATGMLGGFAQGVADAQVAVQQIAAAGLPTDSVVFFAADWDVTSAQFAACDDYLRGAASVIGVDRTGIYAGLHYMNHAHSVGVASAFWQAGATSWNHGETAQMDVHFIQTTSTPPLPGTDHNYINSAGLALLSATPLNAQEDEDMIYPWMFIANDGNGQWFKWDGAVKYPVSQTDAQMLIDCGLAAPTDKAPVKVLGPYIDFIPNGTTEQIDVDALSTSLAAALAPKLPSGATQADVVAAIKSLTFTAK